MKKFFLLVSLIVCSCCAFAEENLAPLLNKVSMQLKAWQWVTTKTAVLTVSINASVTDKGIESMQHTVMQKLTSLSDKGEWHMLSFNRQQDKSGLETVQIMAEVRLPQTELSGLRDKAKSISRPGETYSIENIVFSPSEEELKTAVQSLRANLYQQAKSEIEALNKMYPEQKYYLHQIDFMTPPTIMPVAQNNIFLAKMATSRVAPPALSIGNKQEILANVVLASMPEPVVQKLTSVK